MLYDIIYSLFKYKTELVGIVTILHLTAEIGCTQYFVPGIIFCTYLGNLYTCPHDRPVAEKAHNIYHCYIVRHV